MENMSVVARGWEVGEGIHYKGAAWYNFEGEEISVYNCGGREKTLSKFLELYTTKSTFYHV